MAVIEARGLGKSYGPKRAVDDLSFTVTPGSVTGFLGPNGSGKSTTMRLMLGLDRGEGRTTFDGRTFAELGRQWADLAEPRSQASEPSPTVSPPVAGVLLELSRGLRGE